MNLTNLFISIIIFSIVIGQLVKFPFGISGSATILDLVVGMLCLYGLFLLIIKRELPNLFKIQKLPLYIRSALFFILVAVASWILSPLNLSLSDRLISFLYIVRLIGFIFLSYLIFKGVLPLFKNSTYMLTISGILLAVAGLVQILFFPNLLFLTAYGWDPHYFRVVSTFLDPNFAGGFFVLTLILLFQNTNNVLKFKYRVIFFLIAYLSLATTFSRSSYLMFFVSFATLSILRKSFLNGVLTIILTTGLTLTFYSYTGSVSKPRNIDRENSAESRLNTWEQGFKVFSNSPLIGVGYNNYRSALLTYQLAPNDQLNSRGSTSNDSSLLSVLATTGSIGFLSFIFMLATWFKTGINGLKKTKDLSIVLISALAGLLINSFFVNSLLYPFSLFWIILILSEIRKPSKNI